MRALAAAAVLLALASQVAAAPPKVPELPGFSTESLAPDDTAAFRFEKVGYWTYRDFFHRNLLANLTVTDKLAPGSAVVNVTDEGFNPQALVIGNNTDVTWENHGQLAHRVEQLTGDLHPGVALGAHRAHPANVDSPAAGALAAGAAFALAALAVRRRA